MKRFDLPYGRGTISLSLPESRVKAVLESHLHTYRPDLGEEELVNAALESPEGSPRLSQLAKGKHNVVKMCIRDRLLRAGRRVLGIACDDTHGKTQKSDRFGGWISVNAREKSGPAIMEAVGDGNFYSTMGPVSYTHLDVYKRQAM